MWCGTRAGHRLPLHPGEAGAARGGTSLKISEARVPCCSTTELDQESVVRVVGDLITRRMEFCLICQPSPFPVWKSCYSSTAGVW